MPLKKMKGQRRRHEVGDVFVLQLDDSSYRFGRIVKIGESGPQGRFPGGILAYVYDIASGDPQPDLGSLTPDHLLMPPFFTMNWVWQKGYFRTVAHEEPGSSQLLKQHCFYDASTEGYVDENDGIIADRTEPCGWFALSTFEQFEHEVDEALAGRPVHGAYGRGSSKPPGTP
ncbi:MULTISPECIES: immunity 26/phosphotriesterase HocA family protein [unclassified Streptomyces]|uniref:immunity 26/phosphotriesterase HocA family protein n=1 Tax=unclassified Streptomyces TaxID=2593676 RepID=UPI0022564EE8|nr:MULTISPECIES: immunity 26/phosphotriesterase HocA family protein [unclassified Streptomyces]MCX4989231.1 immunity 26/phosphotriesterase HocA family protein [Streptomyces sp. NBC_00568]MCX5005548.1 immunity 26/phosphotriesterase HocA family protein [Streptomyces sp. NBC_00638]